MEKGFKESRLRLNKYLSEIDKWIEEEIKTRAEALYELSLNIWEYTNTNYIKKKPVENLFSLGDEEDFTNTHVNQYQFMSDTIQIKDWTQLYEKVCLTLYDLEPTTFARIISKNFNDEYMNKRFSNKENSLRAPLKIADNIFIEKNLSTESKLQTLRVIFDEYNLDYNELTFYIK